MAFPALIAAKAKWDRASEDFKTLNREVIRLSKGETYRFEVDFQGETGWYVAYPSIREQSWPDLSVIAGNIAYQLLSALNLIAWELAARKVGRRKVQADTIRRHINFPIAAKPADFESLHLLRYVSKAAVTRLRGTQPYNRPHGPEGPRHHTLFLIKEMADADKHRVLAAVLGRVDAEGITFQWDDSVASGPTFEHLPAAGRSVMEEGTHIARIRFATGNENAKVRVNRQPTAEVMFSTANWFIGTDALAECIVSTAWTIRHLSPLFRGQENPFGPPGPEVPSSLPN